MRASATGRLLNDPKGGSFWFDAGADNLELAYAEAWLACRFIADRYSEARLGQFYAELVRGRTLAPEGVGIVMNRGRIGPACGKESMDRCRGPRRSATCCRARS